MWYYLPEILLLIYIITYGLPKLWHKIIKAGTNDVPDFPEEITD